MADVAGIVGISVACGIFGSLLAYTRDQRDKALDRVAQLEEERAAREAEAPISTRKAEARLAAARKAALIWCFDKHRSAAILADLAAAIDRATDAESPTRVVKTAMRWNGHLTRCTGRSSGAPAIAIVAWVNDNGGEARYEPPVENHNLAKLASGIKYEHGPRIAVRRANGWVYVKLDDTVVMGDKWFHANENCPPPAGRSLREFKVETHG